MLTRPSLNLTFLLKKRFSLSDQDKIAIILKQHYEKEDHSNQYANMFKYKQALASFLVGSCFFYNNIPSLGGFCFLYSLFKLARVYEGHSKWQNIVDQSVIDKHSKSVNNVMEFQFKQHRRKNSLR